jgi:very-short-patch-repair endonuclease
MRPTHDWLIRRAAELRKADFDAETAIWAELRNKRLGFKFRYQHVIGRFIVDFACPEKRVIFEVDGDTHDDEKDARRDRLLTAAGWVVYRATTHEVRENPDGVLVGLLELLESRPSRMGNTYRG